MSFPTHRNKMHISYPVKQRSLEFTNRKRRESTKKEQTPTNREDGINLTLGVRVMAEKKREREVKETKTTNDYQTKTNLVSKSV